MKKYLRRGDKENKIQGIYISGDKKYKQKYMYVYEYVYLWPELFK